MKVQTDLESFRHCCHRRQIFICSAVVVCTLIVFLGPQIGFADSTSLPADDLYLPQSLQCPYKNKTQLEYGRLHLARSRVIICGMIRDREDQIPRLRQQIESITNVFADYAIVIVENDSKDGTRHELIRWAQDKQVNGRIHVIGCGNQINVDRSCNLSLAPTKPKVGPNMLRIEKMVLLRNIYMKYIEDNAQLAKYEYVLVQDFDLWSYTYIDGLLATGFYLSMDPTIDAICANGILQNKLLNGMIPYKTYFDLYAHRDVHDWNWSFKYKDIWSSLFRQYPCNTGLIPVQSCFSGQTIYQFKSIRGKRYRTYVNSYQEAICEHVGLHETLNKIYLNSEMIFYIMKNNLL
jgi:glycosyltransferase involved in cell wall biosynthesis